jgi:hypothetical protein
MSSRMLLRLCCPTCDEVYNQRVETEDADANGPPNLAKEANDAKWLFVENGEQGKQGSEWRGNVRTAASIAPVPRFTARGSPASA